jgi:hypothetical protein
LRNPPAAGFLPLPTAADVQDDLLEEILPQLDALVERMLRLGRDLRASVTAGTDSQDGIETVIAFGARPWPPFAADCVLPVRRHTTKPCLN